MDNPVQGDIVVPMADDGVEFTQLPEPPQRFTPPPKTIFGPAITPAGNPEDERLKILSAFGFKISPAVRPKIPDPAAPPAPAPAAAAPAPAPAREPRKIESPEEIAARAIQNAATKIAAEKASQATPPAEPAEPEDPALSLRLDALRELEKSGRYRDRIGKERDLVSEYKGYLGKLEEYQKRWETGHPGEEFDIESSEHSTWRDSNEPDIDEDDIIRAEGRVEALRVIDEREHRKAQDAMADSLATSAATAASSSIRELMSFADGKERTTLEDLDKDDPVAALVVAPMVERAANVSVAITTLLTPGTPEKFNPHNPAHVEVARLVQHYETEIMKLPEGHRLDGQGRPYVPAEQYVKLPPVERQRAWTFRFAPDEMRALAVSSLRDEAKRRYDATKPRLTPAPAAAPTPAPNPTPPAPRPPAVEGGQAGAVPVSTPAPGSRNRAFWS